MRAPANAPIHSVTNDLRYFFRSSSRLGQRPNLRWSVVPDRLGGRSRLDRALRPNHPQKSRGKARLPALGRHRWQRPSHAPAHLPMSLRCRSASANPRNDTCLLGKLTLFPSRANLSFRTRHCTLFGAAVTRGDRLSGGHLLALSRAPSLPARRTSQGNSRRKTKRTSRIPAAPRPRMARWRRDHQSRSFIGRR